VSSVNKSLTVPGGGQGLPAVVELKGKKEESADLKRVTNRVLAAYKEDAPPKILSFKPVYGKRNVTTEDSGWGFEHAGIKSHEWSLQLKGLTWDLTYSLSASFGSSIMWYGKNRESETVWRSGSEHMLDMDFSSPFKAGMDLPKQAAQARDLVYRSIEALDKGAVLDRYLEEHSSAVVFVDKDDNNFLRLKVGDTETTNQLPDRMSVAVVVDGQVVTDDRKMTLLNDIVRFMVGHPGWGSSQLKIPVRVVAVHAHVPGLPEPRGQSQEEPDARRVVEAYLHT